MKIVFGLGHPAHFHLYKHIMQTLQQRHNVEIYFSDKDILRKLLATTDLPYTSIAQPKINETILSKASKLIFSTKMLYHKLKDNKPDLFVGCLSQLSWVSHMLGTKSIFNAEDDITYTFLQAFITYPFVDTILTSQVVKTGPFSYKQIGYAGYHKLAYLHPNWFTPDEAIKKKYIHDSHYYLIRTVCQNAYHDVNAKGMDLITLKKTVAFLKNYGAVYISSEKKLPSEMQKYALSISEKDIHHILYYSDMLIGDSQSMTVESAMLGTPSIRLNNFANKISILNELEHKYGLTYSISPKQKDNLIPLIEKIKSINKEEFRTRRFALLKDKIDVSAFLIWFIENYPKSIIEFKKNPSIQYQFR